MSLPSADRIDPREVAKATAMSGRVHDVVVGASKVLHKQTLDARDTESLRWARGLLKSAASKDVVMAMPAAQELAGSGNVVMVLRRAVTPDDDANLDQVFSQLGKAVDQALRGDRTEDVIAGVESLRQLFSAVSRFGLQAEVVAQSERPSSRSWAPSTTTSLS
jgi:hypothetical protein